MNQTAAPLRFSRDLKDTGESAAAAMAAGMPNFSPAQNATVSFATQAYAWDPDISPACSLLAKSRRTRFQWNGRKQTNVDHLSCSV
jgi:hypothetical protein